MKFLFNKLIITWSYGDAQIAGRLGQDSEMSRLYQWTSGDKKDLLLLYCYAFRIVTFLLIGAACVSMLGKKTVSRSQFLFVLTLFGAMLFYCFWEVKQAYSVPFVYVMLFIAAHGFASVQQKAETGIRTIECRVPLFVGTAAAVLLFSAILYQELSTNIVTQRQFSIRSISEIMTKYVGSGEDVIRQEFYTEQSFSRILMNLTAEGEEECTYEAVLLDENGHELAAAEINSSELAENGNYTWKMDQIKPKGRQKYVLQLSKITEGESCMRVMVRDSVCVDLYEGVCTVNGEEIPQDLFLTVYDAKSCAFCSERMALLIAGGLSLLFFMACTGWMVQPDGAGKRG